MQEGGAPLGVAARCRRLPACVALRTWPSPALARWYTMVAEVTVLPVPGGPWMSDSGDCSTALTALIWLWLSSGMLGAL